MHSTQLRISRCFPMLALCATIISQFAIAQAVPATQFAPSGSASASSYDPRITLRAHLPIPWNAYRSSNGAPGPLLENVATTRCTPTWTPRPKSAQRRSDYYTKTVRTRCEPVVQMEQKSFTARMRATNCERSADARMMPRQQADRRPSTEGFDSTRLKLALARKR